MQNDSLAVDYLSRCKKRLKAVETLFKEEAWADVVRESQEVVELCLKGLLLFSHIEVPRIHDVGEILLENKAKLPNSLHSKLEAFAEVSRQMRRDRELAFYGSSDLTPSQFYKKKDAQNAKKQAQQLVNIIAPIVLTNKS